jgi:hypothetical protein
LLQAITLYYEFRLVRRRARRCLTVTEHFRLSRHDPPEVWHVADVDVARIAACLRNREGPEEPGFAVTPLAGGGRRAWLNAHALLARGLPTPRPLAWMVDAETHAEYLVTEQPKGALPLEAALRGARGVTEMAGLLRATGAALRGLHDLGARGGGAAHGLLAVRDGPGESGTWKVLFARPEGFRFRPWVGEGFRRSDVARLAAALGHAAPGIPEDAWRAFLRAYLPPGAPAARADALWRAIRTASGL